MKYTIDCQENFTIFTLDERNLNSLVAPDLKSQFFIFHQGGIKNLILDLCNVEFADSSGLSAILTGNRIWSDEGSFIVTGIDHPFVKNLIEISRIDSVLQMIPTLSEAKDYIIMSTIEKELGKED